MPELSGFNAVQKIGPDFGPQALLVPASRTEAVAKAPDLVNAFFGALEARLSNNIKAEFLRDPNTDQIYCRIHLLQRDAINYEIANPGDWVAIDGLSIHAMTNDEFAARFTLPDDPEGQPE